jgi:hypothetical protein
MAETCVIQSVMTYDFTSAGKCLNAYLASGRAGRFHSSIQKEKLNFKQMKTISKIF